MSEFMKEKWILLLNTEIIIMVFKCERFMSAEGLLNVDISVPVEGWL